MPLSTDDRALLELSRRLRSGALGAEHGPAEVADVIDSLLRERRALAAELRATEQLATSRTAGPARTAYAAGWRAACDTVLDRLIFITDHERDIIMGLAPDYSRASEAGAPFLKGGRS